jgi:hypothetical protein
MRAGRVRRPVRDVRERAGVRRQWAMRDPGRLRRSRLSDGRDLRQLPERLHMREQSSLPQRRVLHSCLFRRRLRHRGRVRYELRSRVLERV